MLMMPMQTSCRKEGCGQGQTDCLVCPLASGVPASRVLSTLLSFCSSLLGTLHPLTCEGPAQVPLLGSPCGSLQAPVLFAFYKVIIVTIKTTQPVFSLGMRLHLPHPLPFPLSFPPPFLLILFCLLAFLPVCILKQKGLELEGLGGRENLGDQGG